MTSAATAAAVIVTDEAATVTIRDPDLPSPVIVQPEVAAPVIVQGADGVGPAGPPGPPGPAGVADELPVDPALIFANALI